MFLETQKIFISKMAFAQKVTSFEKLVKMVGTS